MGILWDVLEFALGFLEFPYGSYIFSYDSLAHKGFPNDYLEFAALQIDSL